MLDVIQEDLIITGSTTAGIRVRAYFTHSTKEDKSHYIETRVSIDTLKFKSITSANKNLFLEWTILQDPGLVL